MRGPTSWPLVVLDGAGLVFLLWACDRSTAWGPILLPQLVCMGVALIMAACSLRAAHQASRTAWWGTALAAPFVWSAALVVPIAMLVCSAIATRRRGQDLRARARAWGGPWSLASALAVWSSLIGHAHYALGPDRSWTSWIRSTPYDAWVEALAVSLMMLTVAVVLRSRARWSAWLTVGLHGSLVVASMTTEGILYGPVGVILLVTTLLQTWLHAPTLVDFPRHGDDAFV